MTYGDKKVITVGTTVTRAIEDKLLPSPAATAVLRSIVRGDDMMATIQDSMAGSLGLQVDAMYRYAEQNYSIGSPSGEFYTTNNGITQIQAVLNALEGGGVTIQYAHFGAPNSLHIGWEKIVSLYGYNTSSNILGTLSTAKGSNVYMDDMNVVIPTSYTNKLATPVLEQWGTPPNGGYSLKRPAYNPQLSRMVKHTPHYRDPVAVEDYIKLAYSWSDGSAIQSETVNIPLTGYNELGKFFQVKYTKAGIEKYWSYESGTGVHPSLDALYSDSYVPGGSFFPIAYFRHAGVDTTTNTATQDFLTTKKMLDYIGVDFAEMATNINSNPQIGGVEQAMLMFAVPAKSTDPADCRYLYDFFDSVYASTGDTNTLDKLAAIKQQLNIGYSNTTTKGTIVIQDTKFKMQLTYSSVFKTTKVGVKGKIGSYSSSVTSLTLPGLFRSLEDAIETVNSTVFGHFYYHQISENLYEEIHVSDLKSHYQVLAGYSVTADDTDDILMIPLDYSITKFYPFSLRSILYSRSLHYVFNSVDVQIIKWYQTGAFATLLVIIAIVWTVATGFADGGSALSAAWAGATSAAAATLVILEFVLTQVLIGIVISTVLKRVAKLLGPEVAAALALLAVAYGAYDPAGTTALLGMSMPQILGLTLGLVSAAGNEDLSRRADSLRKDALNTEKYIEEQTKILDTMQDFMDGKHNLLEPMEYIYANANQFYTIRTMANPGVASLQMIPNYVDHALQLPDINQSILIFNEDRNNVA